MDSLSGKLHEAWTEHPELARPVVKTFNLKSAYKQFAISPKEYSKAILCLKEPGSSEVRGFGRLTLPSGAISSVVCFNRVARLFQRIVTTKFKQLAASSHSTVVTLASLLGIRLAQDKDEPAALCADLLGATLDLSDDRLLEVRIANKKSRVAEMSKSLQTVLGEGKVVTSSLPAIDCNQRVSVIDALRRDGLKSLKQRLTESRPRIISAEPRPPALVFTDGSCEPFNDSLRGCVGGVLFVRGRGI